MAGINTNIPNPFGPSGSSLTVSNTLFSDATQAVNSLASGAMDQAQAQAAKQQAAAAQTTAAADLLQGQGDVLEAGAYGGAATLAQQNAAYTTASTNIQLAQGQRQIYQTIGGEKASVAGAGLSGGGTAGDILRSSAQQGALNQAVTASQGQITVAGYKEQAASYTAMQGAAMLASQEQTLAAQGEQDIATGYEAVAQGYETAASYSTISAILSGGAAVASLFATA